MYALWTNVLSLLNALVYCIRLVRENFFVNKRAFFVWFCSVDVLSVFICLLLFGFKPFHPSKVKNNSKCSFLNGRAEGEEGVIIGIFTALEYINALIIRNLNLLAISRMHSSHYQWKPRSMFKSEFGF